MQGDAGESRADPVQDSSDYAREKYGFVDWVLAAFILVVIVSTVVGVPGLIIASFVYLPFPYNVLATVAVIGYFPLARLTGQCWPEIIVQFGITALLLAILIPAVQHAKRLNEERRKAREEQAVEQSAVETSQTGFMLACRDHGAESCGIG